MKKSIFIWILIGVLIMALPLGEAREHSYADIPIRYAMSGWVEEAESRTWTYSSADDPSFVVSVDDDITDYISVGYRVRLKQGGNYLYFGVNKVELSGGNTLLTLYGGTDYDLADSAITNVAVSPMKSPVGFPMNPEKWTVELVDSTDRTTTTFGSVVQVDASHDIDIPIGAWYVGYQAYVGWTGVTTNMNVNLALSTSASSISDVKYQRGIQTVGTGDITPVALNIEMPPKLIVLTSKTTYYLVGIFVSGAGTDWGLLGSTYVPTYIRAVWAYL